MHILNLDTAATATDLDSLRTDADTLAPTSVPPLPAAGPLAGLSGALTSAVAATNDQAVLLSREARRIADNMTVFTDKASLIDGASAHTFEALNP